MKRKRAVFAAAVILFFLALAAVSLWGPSSVPRGQEALLTISQASFNGFENAFDSDADVPRLVLLLSPT